MALSVLTEINETGEGAALASSSFTPATGTLLVACGFHQSGSDRTFSIADTWTNSYTQVTHEHTSAANQRVSLFYAVHAGSGAGTITITPSGATTRESGWFGYVTGEDTAAPVTQVKDGEATTSTTPGITFDSSPAATSLVIGALVTGNDATGGMAGSAAFTTLMNLAATGSGNDIVSSVIYDLASAASLVDWTTADLTPTQTSMVAIEVKEAAAGGGATEDPYPYIGGGYYPTEG